MRNRRRLAFTLIELLVVVAIISLLISITTPSLSRARQQAKATVCMATLSEMMKGIFAYGNDYSFALPTMRYEAKPPNAPKDWLPPSGRPVYHGWAEVLYTSMYSERDYPWDQPYPVMRNIEDNYRFWTCKEAEPQFGSSGGHYRVYEEGWRGGTLEKVRYRLPLITDSAPMVTLPEDLERSDVSKYRLAGLEGEAYIDERHYGGSNFAFRDGHVERSLTLREKLAEDWDLDPLTPNN